MPARAKKELRRGECQTGGSLPHLGSQLVRKEAEQGSQVLGVTYVRVTFPNHPRPPRPLGALVSNSKYSRPPGLMNPKLEGRAWKSHFLRLRTGESHGSPNTATLTRPTQKRQALTVSGCQKRLSPAETSAKRSSGGGSGLSAHSAEPPPGGAQVPGTRDAGPLRTKIWH